MHSTNKLAGIAATTVLIVGLSNPAVAATFSFGPTSGFVNGITGQLEPNGSVNGSFSGDDNNSDGSITADELTAFAFATQGFGDQFGSPFNFSVAWDTNYRIPGTNQEFRPIGQFQYSLAEEVISQLGCCGGGPFFGTNLIYSNERLTALSSPSAGPGPFAIVEGGIPATQVPSEVIPEPGVSPAVLGGLGVLAALRLRAKKAESARKVR